jgi:iron complex outermembrane receptor protein
MLRPRGTAFGVTSLEGERKGVVAKGEFEVANHKVETGIWLEADDYSRFTRRVNHVGGVQSGAVLWNEVNYFWRDYDSSRETIQVFLKDTISLFDDALKVELGVKSLSVDYALADIATSTIHRVAGRRFAGWGPVAGREHGQLPADGGRRSSVTPNDQPFASPANFALPRRR